MSAATAIDHEGLRPTITPKIAGPYTPLVKWVGGKSALLADLVKRLPPLTGRYYEPFAGGAALFFHAGYAAQGGAVLGDMNPDLMHAYREVVRSPEQVIRRLKWMERQHQAGRRQTSTGRSGPSTFYNRTRRQWNCNTAIEARIGSAWTDVQRAAAFLYLNRTCWNGLWRTNRRGDFNVPQGKYKHPTFHDPARIRAAAAALEGASLRTGTWRSTIFDAKAGDIVYFDPPYVPKSPTSSFTSYTAGGFGEREQLELAAGVHELVVRGVFVLASNSDTPMVRKMYRHFEIRRVRAPRALNCKAARRGDVNEVLIIGRPE